MVLAITATSIADRPPAPGVTTTTPFVAVDVWGEVEDLLAMAAGFLLPPPFAVVVSMARVVSISVVEAAIEPDPRSLLGTAVELGGTTELTVRPTPPPISPPKQ